MVFLVLVAIGVVAAIGVATEQSDTPVPTSSDTGSPSPTVSPQPSPPPDVRWTVISDDVRDISGYRFVDIVLNKRVSEEALRAVAWQIYRMSPNHPVVHALYWIEGMDTETTAWAITRWDPNLNLTIMGLTPEDRERLLAEPIPDAQAIVGRWFMDQTSIFKGVVTIYVDEQGTPFMQHIFEDGSDATYKLTETPTTTGRRFVWVDIFRESYIIVESGQGGRLLNYTESGLSSVGNPVASDSTASATASVTPVSTPTVAVTPTATTEPLSQPRSRTTPTEYDRCEDVPSSLLRLDTQGRVAVQRQIVPSQPDGDNDDFACGSQLEHKRHLLAPTPSARPTSTAKLTPTPQPTPSAVTVRELVDAWDNNSIAADRKYKGRTINIEGHLESIDTIFGSVIVTLNDGSPISFTGVQCTLKGGQEDRMAQINKGERLVFRGTITGLNLIYVGADDCVLLGVYR